MRVIAQLIDATQDPHLWSERYDRPLKDIFALQDEIVQKIVTTLQLQLTLLEQGWLVRKRTNNLEAYDFYLRGLEYSGRVTKEANAQARQMFEKAIELDPQYAAAYASLSGTYRTEWTAQWSQDPQTLEQAFALAQKAVVLDDSLPEAHTILGLSYLYKNQYDQATAEARRAITLDPNKDDSYMQLGRILVRAGRPEEAIELIEKAMRLNPRYPAFYLEILGSAYVVMGRCEETTAIQKRTLTRSPNSLTAHLTLAICYAEAGRATEAQTEAAEVLRVSPNFSVDRWRQNASIKDAAIVERLVAGMRKAGLK